MDNENGNQREVIIVLSDELAPRMPELALGHQVWALRTAATEKVAQRFWKEHPPLGMAGSGGITLFAGEGDPEKDVVAILDGVELHHGIASSERPAVSVLRVLSAAASETISDVLCSQGSLASNRGQTGFLPAGIVSDPAGSAAQIIAREPPSDSTGPTIYVYGRRQTTIEQINNTTGAVRYLHHDQAGSTRLIPPSTLILVALDTGFT